jgi:hypothetical protein
MMVQIVHLYRSILELRLEYLYVIDIVHFIGEMKLNCTLFCIII